MRCQICDENNATIHLTEIEKGVQKELHICEPCAIKKGIIQKNHITLKEFLGKIASQSEGEDDESESSIRCPGCGASFQDFGSSGRLGCAQDYEVFENDLLPLLEKMHAGASQHAGKIPSGAGELVAKEKELRELKLSLEKLISQEKYEEAARIRDQIKQLESHHGH